ncbi:MAG: hypothetical protein ROM03_08765 [Mucispirillum sp.]|nr:hypothetical protein [Mucispirillum sp.]
MILYYILKPLVILLNHTPRKVLHGMAKFMAFCLWHLSKDRRHVAVTNAKILGAKDPYKTARKSFDYTFMAYLDIFYAHRIGDDYIKNHVTIEGRQIYDKVKNEDNKFVFVGGHFGTWSLLATIVPQALDTQVITIGRSTKNAALDKILDELRTFERVKYVTHRGAMEKLSSYINEGCIPGVYIDHTATAKDCINADFCGYKVPVIAGIPALCARKNYPIVFFFGLYDGLNTKVILKGPVYPDKTLKPKERIIKIAEDINKVYEEVFKQYPEQWYLIHRRFKRVELEDGTMSDHVYKESR